MSRSIKLLRRLVPPWGVGVGRAAPRRPRTLQPEVDGLEGRVVLSRFGGMAGEAMASRAAMFGRAGGGGGPAGGDFGGPRGGFGGPRGDFGGGPRGGGVAGDSQLSADLKAYRAEATAVLRGSSVTDAQRVELHESFQAVREAGVAYDRDAVAAAADDVLASIADPAGAAAPESFRADFVAAFAGATDAGDADAALTADELALVNAAFDAFVAVADGLDVDSGELAALSSARDAIAADYTRLGIDRDPPASLELILGGPGGGGSRASC